MTVVVETTDGNVVAAGHTAGSWVGINDGHFDVAAAKLRAENGEVLWTYQVRQTSSSTEGLLASVLRCNHPHLVMWVMYRRSTCLTEQGRYLEISRTFS